MDGFPPTHMDYYMPVLVRNNENTNIKTAKTTEMPKRTNANSPKPVNAPAPLFAVGSQTNVWKAVKTLLAKSVRMLKPSLIALTIAVPMRYLLSYIYILTLIYI